MAHLGGGICGVVYFGNRAVLLKGFHLNYSFAFDKFLPIDFL